MTVGKRLRVTGRIHCNNLGKMNIGNMVTLNSAPDKNYVGGDRKIALWTGKRGSLVIESGVGISGATIVAQESVKIGENTLIGGGCDIYDTDFHEINPYERLERAGNIKTAPVEIGANVFIGSHSIILKGVTVGEGSVIGAGSVISKNVPPYEIWAGRPAQRIASLSKHKGHRSV